MDADFNPLLIVSCGFLIRVYPCASVVEVCSCFLMLHTIYAILSLTSGARPDATYDLRTMVLSFTLLLVFSATSAFSAVT